MLDTGVTVWHAQVVPEKEEDRFLRARYYLVYFRNEKHIAFENLKDSREEVYT